jgi:hypothetical protein
MSTSPRTILYSSLTCPFAQRVRIALIEAGAPFELELIDLKNKPECVSNFLKASHHSLPLTAEMVWVNQMVRAQHQPC